MSGLYDQLMSHLDDESQGETPIYDKIQEQLDDESAGITSFDIMKLPRTQKQIMLFLLRDTQAATQGITIEGLEERLTNTPEDLLDTLSALAQNGWLIVSGEAPHYLYRIHMRRKQESQLGFGIWSVLSNRLTSDQQSEE